MNHLTQQTLSREARERLKQSLRGETK
jgi:hypothetical protein